jgi:hypothetical protein
MIMPSLRDSDIKNNSVSNHVIPSGFKTKGFQRDDMIIEKINHLIKSPRDDIILKQNLPY